MLKNLDTAKVITPGSGLGFSHPVDTDATPQVATTPHTGHTAIGGVAGAAPVTPVSMRSTEHLPVLDEAAPKPSALIVARNAHTRTLKAALAAPRLAIEKVSPAVDDGAFPVKRTVGDTVRVEADVFMDGHDHIAVALLWRAADVDEWNEAPMYAIGNDRWAGSFPLDRVGSHVFTIEAWCATWATLQARLHTKSTAGEDVSLDIAEACAFIEQTALQTPVQSVELDALVSDLWSAITYDKQVSEGSTSKSVSNTLNLLLAPATAVTLAASERRAFVLRLEQRYQVDADRAIAAFASWYELFPRSQGAASEDHHGSFNDVVERMPAIRAMGFDVLYFPPIHPIGKTRRRGRNNAPTAAENDPGSPYAIGSDAGGHDAIHPQLGDFEDFARMVAAASTHGLEVALDFAIQCSPDHPWLRDHPEWFEWRADGSLQHAENPAEKFGDIVNVDFYAGGGANGPVAPALWRALRDIVLFWVGQNIRIFRVSNPHTKPLSFWQWLITEVRSKHPDVIFLAEAFTRPKVMARLAKIGYSQSYTYFTWRESKQDLALYLAELNAQPLCEFFRPHFFVNTPDINPRFLQRSGRAGFVVRAALAGFLSGLWGLYSGFELCEAASIPGKEEYLDSEKYQIKVRSWEQPGNIINEITLINSIRRLCPALQSHLGLAFHHADNDQILFFSKTHPAKANGQPDDIVLVAINLDPFNAQESDVEIPLENWGLPDDGQFAVEDMVNGNRWMCRGPHHSIRLDPAVLPFLVWRVTPVRASTDTTADVGLLARLH